MPASRSAGRPGAAASATPFGRRGYYSSFTLQGVQAGQIIAAAAFQPMSALLPEAPSSPGLATYVIPFVGNLSDRIGRRPCIIVGALGSGVLSYAYLYFISQGNVTMAFIFAVLMWGIVYQGYNAVFPSFYQELFPTRTRVTAFAVSQNIGTMITAFLPTLYAIVAPARGQRCI